MKGIIHICRCVESGSWKCVRTGKLCPYTSSWVAACEQFDNDGIKEIRALRAPYFACEHYPKSEEEENVNL